MRSTAMGATGRLLLGLIIMQAASLAACGGKWAKLVDGNRVVEGVLDVVRISGSENDDLFYSLRSGANGSGQRRPVFFTNTPPAGLVTGMRVRLFVDETVEHHEDRPAGKRSIYANKVEVLQVPGGKKDYTMTRDGTPYNFKSLTFVLSICGVPASVTADDMRSMWFTSHAPNASSHTLQGYFRSCSYDRVRFEEEDNAVFSVPVPCNGTSRTGWLFDHTQCRIDEVYGWAEYAEDYVAKQFKVTLDQYQNRIVVLPKNACTWGGLGTVGCKGSCYSWIKGDQAKILDTFVHELGHNMGLQHSSTPTSEYGDMSSPMGNCCDSPRCYNGPNSWQLNWAAPKSVLNTKTLQPGKWVRVALPALASARQSLVQLTPDWRSKGLPREPDAPPEVPVYYMSYRNRQGYDAGLDSAFVEKLTIHIYNGSTGYMSNGFLSELRGVLTQGLMWTDPINKFRVQVSSATNASALVSVCRFTAAMETEATCNDGLDNDCSGKWDKDDANCKRFGTLPICNNNGTCDRGETAMSCPDDCPAKCGDSFCDRRRGESAQTCPQDCPAKCGDGFCDAARGEATANCPGDCPKVVCGDGQCAAGVETAGSCPQDCCPESRCGDGICDAYGGENCVTCPKDCAGMRIGDKPFCCGSPTDLYGCGDTRCNLRERRCRETCASARTA